MIHGWNLVEVSIYPGDETIAKNAGVTSVGLLNLFSALVAATEDFLERLGGDQKLQKNTLRRYKQLQQSAKP